MTTKKGEVFKDTGRKGQFEELPEPWRQAMGEIVDEKMTMTTKAVPKPKPLTVILDQMDDNIRAAAKAARRAEEAAKAAKQAAGTAAKASKEAAKRAEEAAEDATRAAAEAANRAEETANAAREAAEAAARKAEDADKSARKAIEAFKKAADEAATRVETAAVEASMRTEAKMLKRIESLEEQLRRLEDAIPKEKIIVLREINKDEAKAEIEQLFAEGETLYYSDIARKLRIDLELVVAICEELIKEGKVRVGNSS